MSRRHIIIGTMLLLASAMQAQELVRVEYFFDTDPGYGNGIPLAQPSTGENTYEMSFESVTPGYHLLSLRAQDEFGRWTTVMSRPIYVINPLKVTAVEYFFDTDPGEGNAMAVPLPDDLSEAFAFKVPTEQLEVGEHIISVRARGQDGIWTIVSTKAFAICNMDGDVNGDGTVNADDIMEVLNYIMGSPSEIIKKEAANVNGDETVNTADIVKIVNIIMGQ